MHIFRKKIHQRMVMKNNDCQGWRWYTDPFSRHENAGHCMLVTPHAKSPRECSCSFSGFLDNDKISCPGAFASFYETREEENQMEETHGSQSTSMEFSWLVKDVFSFLIHDVALLIKTGYICLISAALLIALVSKRTLHPGKVGRLIVAADSPSH